MFIFSSESTKIFNMKKLSKQNLKEIIAGGEICLECAIDYFQCIIDGKCYCIPQGEYCPGQ